MTITQVPLVDYLVLEGTPHLTANECKKCGARYFDRRNACASCFAVDFKKVDIANEGIVRSFTIVTFAAPGVPVPFVAAIIDCGGTSVRGNLANVDPTPIDCIAAVFNWLFSLTDILLSQLEYRSI